jgi:hypothetical protein
MDRGTRLSRLSTLVAVATAVALSAALPLHTWGQEIPFLGDFSQVPDVSVQDDVYSMRFAVYDAEWGGNRLWPATWEYEEHPFVTVSDGAFEVALGSRGVPTDSLSTVAGPLFVEVSLCLPASYECPGFEPLPSRLLLASSPSGDDGEESYEEAETSSPSGPGTAWSLGGNEIAGLATAFLGTMDLAPLVIRVGGLEALRLIPQIESPVILGGVVGNSASSGIAGALICGGGASSRPNAVRASFAAIVGGLGNEASGRTSFVGGGLDNTAFGQLAVVVGGEANQANGELSAIGGGSSNYANESFTTIAGGDGNEALAPGSSVGGGTKNSAGGIGAVVAGGESNEASGDGSGIGGGSGNCIGTCDLRLPSESDGDYSFIAGGYGNRVAGTLSFAAGENGVVRGDYAAVVGGSGNHVVGDYGLAFGMACTVNGDSAVALGTMAAAFHTGAFVWADSTRETFGSTAEDQFSVRAKNGARFETDEDAGLEVSGKIKSSRGGFVFPDGTVQTTSAELPRGVIVMWSGTSIPAGWALCDGSQGTPNLVDRFVMGAKSPSLAGETGGSATHTHTTEAHAHDLEDLTGPRYASRDNVDSTGRDVCGSPMEVYTYHAAKDKTLMYCRDHRHSVTVTDTATVVVNEAASLPPYYALAFIMKL